MQTQPFVIERTLNATIAKVWKAITDRNDMEQWYFNLAEFKPEPGFVFRFPAPGNEGKPYMHICEITEVIPGKKLSYSWRYEGYPGNSQVSFELFEEGNQTKLKLTHTGLETFPANNPDFARESFASGWTYIIAESLPAFLNKVLIPRML